MSEELIQNVKQTLEEAKRLFETEFKAAVKKGDEERKATNDQLGQTKEKLAKMEDTFNKYQDAWNEYESKQKALEAKLKATEEILAAMQRPGSEQKAEDPYWEKISKRHGYKFLTEEEWSSWLRTESHERKSLQTGSDAAGGFLLPLNRLQQIIELNVLISPVRQIASLYNIATGDTLEIPKEGSTAFTASWTSERGSRSETTAGTFAMEKIPVHECYSNPFVTQKMLDDAAFDVEGYINRKLAEQFAKLEGTAFISGNAVGQPEGIATNASVATQVCTATGAFTGALLIDLAYLLPERYAANATWVSKRVNFGKIRQLAGNEGYLWQPGISADKGPTLLGRPYVEAPDVATIVSASAGDKVIYFGDFRAGYAIVDRIGMNMVRDPFTNKPYIEFYTTKRVGGQVVLPEAIVIGTVNS